MAEFSEQVMRAALDGAPEGIVIFQSCPPDHPILYVNRVFTRLSGHGAAQLIGQDMRRLQASDGELEGAIELSAALDRGQACRIQLNNARKDGTQVCLELRLQPLANADESAPKHFMGLLRELSERERAAAPAVPGLASWLREDRLSGLCSRAYFEQLLQRDWQIGLREARTLTLLVFDIDELGTYNDTYGRAAGDACIRRVAGVIGASFRRGSDLVARWQGGCIVALVRNSEIESVPAFAAGVAQRVLDQHIHHPRARRQKFVCVSVGAATLTPSNHHSTNALVQAALSALKKAKQDRQSRVAVAGPTEID